MKYNLLFIGTPLIIFGLYNMLWHFLIYDQINEPFPMFIFGYHFPFEYTFLDPAFTFEKGILSYDSYWLFWSISLWFGIAFILIFTFREIKQKII